jgi:hypothetical protein
VGVKTQEKIRLGRFQASGSEIFNSIEKVMGRELTFKHWTFEMVVS